MNGKLHGKGKIFHKGELSFEGEFLYDYSLKGKNYLDRKLEYEGDYLYDKKWNGKGFDENGILLYELKDGKGNVREYTHSFFGKWKKKWRRKRILP